MHLYHCPVAGSCRNRSEMPSPFRSMTNFCQPGHQSPEDSVVNWAPPVMIFDQCPVVALKRKKSVSPSSFKSGGRTDHSDNQLPWLCCRNPPASWLICRDQLPVPEW